MKKLAHKRYHPLRTYLFMAFFVECSCKHSHVGSLIKSCVSIQVTYIVWHVVHFPETSFSWHVHKSTDFTLQFVSLLCKKILHRFCAILQRCSVGDEASGGRIQHIAETSLYKRPRRRESCISKLSPNKARQCHRLSLFLKTNHSETSKLF